MPRGFSKEAEFEIEKRRKAVSAFLSAGLNYRDMAKQLNVSHGTIANDVKVIIKRLHAAQVLDYTGILEIELRRIDIALNAIWGQVQGGNLGAITKLLQLQNQRVKFLGFRSEVETARGNTNLPELEDLKLVKQKRWNQVAGQVTRLVTAPSIMIMEADDATGLH